MRTTTNQTLFEVPLKGGKIWRGTEQELRTKHPTWVNYATMVQPQATADDADFDDDGAYDDQWPSKLPTSARRYAPIGQGQPTEYEYQDEIVQAKIPRRQSAQRQPRPNLNRAQPPDVIEGQPAHQRYTEHPRAVRRRRPWVLRVLFAHPFVWLGFGMLLMPGCFVGWQVTSSWWTVHQDDVTCGRPRTTQYDVVVGHSDSPQNPTHIIALNLNARVIIIELPGGDSSKSIIYKGPLLLGQDAFLSPVTLTFSDPQHTGKPLMIVHVQGGTIVYRNEKVNNIWQFVPPHS